jgi:hypothetical protein
MKKILIFVCCLLSQLSTTFSQEPFVVISTNGLKLRKTPGQNGLVLAIVPFGAKVDVLTAQNGQYGRVEYDPPARRDSIGELFPTRYNSRSSLHIGHWWRVRYGRKTGYMFSGFLADSGMLHSNYGELNDQFRLRSTWGNAGFSNNPEFDPDWYWYGVFSGDNGFFILKKVEPRYAVEDHTDEAGFFELYSHEVVIQIDPPERPVWIIGTRKKWTTQTEISGFNIETAPLVQFDKHTGKVDSAFLKKYFIEVEENTKPEERSGGREIPTWYMIDKQGRRQAVAPLTFQSGYAIYPTALAWAGDLDMDGNLDYIFEASGEIGYYVLYLSSQAEKGEIAKPVAVLWSWYTC